ncbi:hypothetical protein EPN52_08640 [bacterium]|nr:MAG: hypothetical protein EPN52_08640 [bacterium]
MEIARALSDLEEVRERLAGCQRFHGYSGRAAAISGWVALAAGGVQRLLAPHPSAPAELRLYLAIWLGCLAIGLAVNYGALAVWYWRIADDRERRQTRTVGATILPAISLSAMLTLALLDVHAEALLPGSWFAAYGTGLFASRAMVPRGMTAVACVYMLAGAALLLLPNHALALSWWVMPFGFGLGMLWIGWLLAHEHAREHAA